jgi:hypothetical protein
VAIRTFCRFIQRLDDNRYFSELRTLLVLLVSACLVHGTALSQLRQPSISIPLTLTDGVATATLFFGFDSAASDSLDRLFGESELPPLPPSGVFDARFVGFDISMPLGLGTQKDFRPGDAGMTGQRIHELMYQTSTGRTVTVRWNLPAGTTAILQDIYLGSLINVNMKDSGSYAVQNPSVFNRLKMTVQYTTVSSVDVDLPGHFVLYQNYPNPFNPITKIGYRVPSPGARWVRLSVCDILGREQAVLTNERKDPGEYAAIFDGTRFGTGSYFYRLESSGAVAIKSMVLLK